MRLIRILTLFLFCGFCSQASAQNAWCQLKGPVFVDTNPARIQYRVYLEESESFADILVFKAANVLFADGPGKWYFTSSRAEAGFSIIFVKERSQADFSIHFIDTESFAGCQTGR
jgi:hypothetical protein